MRAFSGAVVVVLQIALLCRLPRRSESSRANTIRDLLFELSSNEVHAAGYDQAAVGYSWSLFKHSVTYWLYTKESPDVGHRLLANDTETLFSSSFNEENPTKILIHGWLGNGNDTGSVCSVIKSEYFALDRDYNVICVDWRSLSSDLPYITARWQCENIGNDVAEMIWMLTNQTNQELTDVHMIGLSMGAHIAGYAGKRLDGQIQRITGLDPAKPYFPENKPQERLSKDDAMFVDIVHTSSIILGQHRPIGTIDFYPNGGNTKQPDCGFEYIYGEVCSHLKALEFYASSIRAKDTFRSVKCNSWDDYKRSACDGDRDGDDYYTYLGEYANPKFSGNYYLWVSQRSAVGHAPGRE